MKGVLLDLRDEINKGKVCGNRRKGVFSPIRQTPRQVSTNQPPGQGAEGERTAFVPILHGVNEWKENQRALSAEMRGGSKG